MPRTAQGPMQIPRCVAFRVYGLGLKGLRAWSPIFQEPSLSLRERGPAQPVVKSFLGPFSTLNPDS